ncbi:MAG: hypothetical protein WCS14_04285 [Candidatus Methanomethylophilaceae archaeon]
MTAESISRIFADVGREYGFSDVSVEIVPFTELKISWERSITWADFMISDRLEGAPEDVIESIAITAHTKMRSGTRAIPYTKATIDWIESHKMEAVE